jgi:3-deoxy-manno-octulosonate cytidylyltransferase (CMP-KDO synthetase)
MHVLKWCMPKAVVLIPARYQSSRFPGKPLALIAGRPMIQHVYENMRASGFASYVVTDDERIEKTVRAFGGQCLRVDEDVPSGSERIALAVERYLTGAAAPEFIINVQGDEPLLPGSVLKRLVDYHAASGFDIATIVRPRQRHEEDWSNPNVVKAVIGQGGRCLYFSRASVPFQRDGTQAPWFQHVGIYCYRREALKRFLGLPMAVLEDAEKLEQLRALENGMSLGAIVESLRLLGVDVPEDVLKVEEALRG